MRSPRVETWCAKSRRLKCRRCIACAEEARHEDIAYLLATTIVLDDRAEESFRQAMLGSQAAWRFSGSNWLVGTILLLWPIFTWLWGKRRSGRSEPMPAPAGAAAVDRQP
jgi:hypothetical protein